MHHVGLAHGRAIEVMRGLGMGNLGAVCNMEYAAPADDTPEAAAAAALYDGYYNRWFLSAMFKGEYPTDVLEGLGPHMPDEWQADMATIAAPVDWVGINYYTRKLIAPAPGPWPALQEVDGPLPKTQMGWEIYPKGLEFFLRRTAKDYSGDLPIYITENGMAGADVLAEGMVNDTARIDYLAQHLAAVQRVAADGVPVKGYFTWSLMDNFEWSLGYEKRFGLIHVDFETLQRTPKASYHALSAALSRRA
jgi:beta-glucosidase